MEGLSRWDLVLWVAVAYLAVMAMVRLMIQHRNVTVRKLRDQLERQQRRKAKDSTAGSRREAA